MILDFSNDNILIVKSKKETLYGWFVSLQNILDWTVPYYCITINVQLYYNL